jgi:protein-tyrosine phosphatase
LPFIDLHSHILPGFDDGASSEAEFLEMAQIAVRGGTSVMAATPHYDLESRSAKVEEIASAVEEHARLLRERGIPLTLVRGVEVRLNAGLFNLAKENGGLDELGLGSSGKFMLVDLPLFDIPVATNDILFQIQLSGLTPILAHPERNRYLAKHPTKVGEMADRGIEMQVNAGSLEGIYGKTAQRFAHALLIEGVAKLVASDAHKPWGRSPDLSAAAAIIQSKLGAEAARIMLELNPKHVLAGEHLKETVGFRLRRRKAVPSPTRRGSL